MPEYRQYELGSVCARLSSGKGIPASQVFNEGAFPVYGGNGLRGYTDHSNFRGDCAIIGRQGAFCGNVRYFNGEAYMTEHAVVVCANECHNTRYLAYLLSQMNLGRLSGQSAQPGLSVKTLAKQVIELPPLDVQNKVVAVLSSLDSKIALNEKINDILLAQAQTLYKQFFPYGVQDDLPDGWRIGTVGEIIEIHDSKRIPLSGADRTKMEKKIYPYYGAASLMDFVDNYIFDGKYLLLGEDGTVVDDAGYPILQYVWGQFWVNNHAHILTGRLGYDVESLYMLFKQTPVKSIVTGAVQPKISQANLRSVQVVIPPEHNLREYNGLVEPLFSLFRANEEECKTFTALRDTLLPKLMSGEIDVSAVQL